MNNWTGSKPILYFNHEEMDKIASSIREKASNLRSGLEKIGPALDTLDSSMPGAAIGKRFESLLGLTMRGIFRHIETLEYHRSGIIKTGEDFDRADDLAGSALHSTISIAGF